MLQTFGKVQNPLCLPRKTASEHPKVVRPPWIFPLLTWKCASRHNSVHFFDISISKSVPNMVCFAHFDSEMCFPPQGRALFRHLNFWKCSEHGVLCTFWLRNVFRATTACNFSSLIRPDCSAPAALASLHFDPPEPQIIGQTQCFATFLPFRAPGSYFLWLSRLLSSSLLFSSVTLPISAFHLSILSVNKPFTQWEVTTEPKWTFRRRVRISSKDHDVFSRRTDPFFPLYSHSHCISIKSFFVGWQQWVDDHHHVFSTRFVWK